MRAVHQQFIHCEYDLVMRKRPVIVTDPAEEARALRYARFSRLRRLAQAEGLSVHDVMTGRVVPAGFPSILSRSGLIKPEPIDFSTLQWELAEAGLRSG